MNREALFDNLKGIRDFLEESLTVDDLSGDAPFRSKLLLSSWQNLSNIDKQNKRRQYYSIGIRDKSVIDLDYYLKLIRLYDELIEQISYLKYVLMKNGSNINKCRHVIKLMALILLEIDNIDEDILPKRHVPTRYFQNLVDQIKDEIPEIDLSGFINIYDDMYKHWEI